MPGKNSSLFIKINPTNKKCKFRKINKTHLTYPILHDTSDDENSNDSYKTLIESIKSKIQETFPNTNGIIYTQEKIEINFDCFTAQEIISSILPNDLEPISGFATIGHICHINLPTKPEEVYEKYKKYENILGEILLKKLGPKIRTVLTKTCKIESKFRTLPIKLIAGEDNYICRHLEHGCVFEMDFSKVYWNSRLQEEHKDVVDFIIKEYGNSTNSSNIISKPDFSVIDTCCGIGPFAIPLAKKLSSKQFKNFEYIFANDLNPDSMKYFIENIKINKLTHLANSSLFHSEADKPMDGVDFFADSIKTGKLSDQILIVLMNLPRFSVSLLMPKMVKCLNKCTSEHLPKKVLIIAHHMSGKDETSEQDVQKVLPVGFKLQKIWQVRKLIGENYLRILVQVDIGVLLGESELTEVCGPEIKKLKKSSNS